MRPAASYSDGFRFEKGQSAEGLFYNPGVSSAAAFSDEFVILTGAAWGHGLALAGFVALSSVLY